MGTENIFSTPFTTKKTPTHNSSSEPARLKSQSHLAHDHGKKCIIDNTSKSDATELVSIDLDDSTSVSTPHCPIASHPDNDKVQELRKASRPAC